MVTRRGARQPIKAKPAPGILCAHCEVLVAEFDGVWRHVTMLDPARYTTCSTPAPGRVAKAYEVLAGTGQKPRPRPSR